MMILSLFPPIILKNFSSISPLSARKLVLLVSLTQNANLISKLWTIAAPIFFFNLCNWLRREQLGFQGAQFLPSRFMFFTSQNLHMYIVYVDGLMKAFIKICWHLMLRYKLLLHRTQKTAVLNTILQLLLWLWRKMRKGWLLFFCLIDCFERYIDKL